MDDQELMLDDQEEMDLYIVFTVASNLFCVNCSYISGIMQLQECTPVPDAPQEVRGVIHYRNEVITLYDVRAAMHMGLLQQQFKEFCDMIEARKQDHVRWVQALEDTVQNGASFSLATDSHKCALGKWRDTFKTDSNKVNSLLKRLDEPHAALHHSAIEILNLMKAGESPANRKAIMAIFNHVKDVFMPAVLGILDEMMEMFQESVFREMVITLNGSQNRGIIVENIHSVESLIEVSGAGGTSQLVDRTYIKSVKRSERMPGLILELDPNALMETVEDFELTY